MSRAYSMPSTRYLAEEEKLDTIREVMEEPEDGLYQAKTQADRRSSGFADSYLKNMYEMRMTSFPMAISGTPHRLNKKNF